MANQKFKYLKQTRVPFIGLVIRREISESQYLNGVRAFFAGAEDADILTIVQHSAEMENATGGMMGGLRYNNGRSIFSVQLRGS